jgi:hypothetical protein
VPLEPAFSELEKHNAALAIAKWTPTMLACQKVMWVFLNVGTHTTNKLLSAINKL